MPMVAGSGCAFKSEHGVDFCLASVGSTRRQTRNIVLRCIKIPTFKGKYSIDATNVAKANKTHSKLKSLQTASAKAQVTIPANIRKALGIIAGSPIRFIESDGLVVLKKVDVNLSSLCGGVVIRACFCADA